MSEAGSGDCSGKPIVEPKVSLDKAQTSDAAKKEVEVSGAGDGPSSKGRKITPLAKCVDMTRIKHNDVFVGNLSLFTDNARLGEYFAKFGTIKDVRIMFHPETGRSRRYGFVSFDNPQVVQAVLNFSGHLLDGKTLDIKHAFKRSDEDDLSTVKPIATATDLRRAESKSMTFMGQGQASKVFVGGVGQNATSQDVDDYFSQYGKVEAACLLPDSVTGRHRGFGFVNFEAEMSVELVCSVRYHILKGRKVEVKRALPRHEHFKIKQQIESSKFANAKSQTAPPPLLLNYPLPQLQQQNAQGLVLPNFSAFVSPAPIPATDYKAGNKLPGTLRYSPYPLRTNPAATHVNFPSPTAIPDPSLSSPIQAMLLAPSQTGFAVYPTVSNPFFGFSNFQQQYSADPGLGGAGIFPSPATISAAPQMTFSPINSDPVHLGPTEAAGEPNGDRKGGERKTKL